jgi:hypothetical protein
MHEQVSAQRDQQDDQEQCNSGQCSQRLLPAVWTKPGSVFDADELSGLSPNQAHETGRMFPFYPVQPVVELTRSVLELVIVPTSIHRLGVGK